jgi:hypothetical protein
MIRGWKVQDMACGCYDVARVSHSATMRVLFAC